MKWPYIAWPFNTGFTVVELVSLWDITIIPIQCNYGEVGLKHIVPHIVKLLEY